MLEKMKVDLIVNNNKRLLNSQTINLANKDKKTIFNEIRFGPKKLNENWNL
jgi:hypothetical protein